MKRFWRIVIGTGMVIFGMAGIYSAYNSGVALPDDDVEMQDQTVFPSFLKQNKKEKQAEDMPTDAEKSVDNPDNTNAKDEQKPVEYTAEQKKADQSLFKEIVTAKEVERCDEIINIGIRSSCRDSIRLSLALRDKALALCDKIESQEKRGYCRDEILLIQAEENNDYTHCADIINETMRSRCQGDEARKQIMEVTNISDCEDIASKSERELCFDFYIAQKAAAQNEQEGLSTCDQISNTDLRKQCKLKNAVQAAEQSNKIEPCEQLEDEELQATCLKQLKFELDKEVTETFIADGDIEGCASMADAGGRQYCLDNALMMKAVEKHDPKLCRDITSDKKRTQCSEDAGKAENMFLFETAKDKKDVKWCDLITNPDAQKSCISIVSNLK